MNFDKSLGKIILFLDEKLRKNEKQSSKTKSELIKAISRVEKATRKNKPLKIEQKDYTELLKAIENKIDDDNIIEALSEIKKAVKEIESPEINIEKVDKIKPQKLLEKIEAKKTDLAVPEKMEVELTKKQLKLLTPYPVTGVDARIVNSEDERVNPATEEKQDEMISKLENYVTLIDDYTTTNVTYIGKAVAGSSEGATVWQIKALDETGNYLKIKYAGGESTFTNEWDERVNYTYS